ncbi:MAG: hypothetical protein ACTSR8_13050 [Promethearchaeota archaeon]
MKQENKDASIDELRDRLFDYFKVDIYITKNAIDYNGFERVRGFIDIIRKQAG